MPVHVGYGCEELGFGPSLLVLQLFAVSRSSYCLHMAQAGIGSYTIIVYCTVTGMWQMLKKVLKEHLGCTHTMLFPPTVTESIFQHNVET